MRKYFRHLFQSGWALLTNSHFSGFVSGKIYQGQLKKVCLPGLNCYSCPGALGACPIGSLQAVSGSWKFNIPFYVAGFLLAFGAVCARFICGWLCPFGLVQDLLHKIPMPRIGAFMPRKIQTFPGDRPLRLLKFVVLALFVIILPLTLVNVAGQGQPWFCKLICPSGTLFAGWPLVLTNPSLWAAAKWLFAWKNLVLLVIVLMSILIYRPFCKYLCPLGAIYGLLNRLSFYRLRINGSRCTNCKACERACKMGVDPKRAPDSIECIRCGDCKRACKFGALDFAFLGQAVQREKTARPEPSREQTA